MTLGPYLLLRRIDTDFVNLTPIVEWCGKGRGYPVLSMVPNAVVIERGWGSDKVCGVWVPLEVAQSYVKDLDTCSTNTGRDEAMEGLDVFLGDELVERFPSALKDFHRTNSSGRMLKQFGRWFESMVTFAHAQTAATTTVAANTSMGTVANVGCGPLNPQKVIQADSRQSWMQKDTVVPVPMTGAFTLGTVLAIGEREKLEQLRDELSSQPCQGQLRRTRNLKQDDCLDVASPLSAKEEEIFQELCVIPGEEEEKAKVEEMEGMTAIVKAEEYISKVVVVEGGGGVSINVNVDMVEEAERKPPLFVEEAQPAPDTILEEPSPPFATTDVPAIGTKAVAAKTRSTRAATMSKVSEKQVEERQEKNQALRRSKRVADALAAQTQLQQQQKTRSRKRPGSRNTLS